MVATDGERGRGKISKKISNFLEKNVMSAQMLQVSLGVGTVLRLERDAWLMVR